MKPYYELTPKNIWNFRQNNPELVIKDAKEFLDLDNEQCRVLRQIMLARGINKWLKVRRDIIAYKKIIKHQIKDTQKSLIVNKETLKRTTYKSVPYYLLLREKYMLKNRLKMLEIIRRDLKKMCMTDRWQIWKPSTSNSILREMNTITTSD